MKLLRWANLALIVSVAMTLFSVALTVLKIAYPMPISLILVISCMAMLASGAVRVALAAMTWLRWKPKR